MRLINKIAKSGVFCDKRFEHFMLESLCHSNAMGVYKEQGSVDVDVNFYHTDYIVDVADYEDGLVRLRAYISLDKNKECEIGRIVMLKDDFVGNIYYLTRQRTGI